MTDKHQTIPEWPDDLTEGIRQALVSSNRTLVVLDDDPTGTQTVYDVPVLTVFDEPSLTEAIEAAPPVLYILTNSRSMTELQTHELHVQLAQRLRDVAKKTGRRLELISRSDSTLRGHYPAETDTIAGVWPEQADLTLVMPFFAEGGRLTIDGQHYVCDGESMVAAHETPFAKDPVFGFQTSCLPDWVEEKTKGRVKADDVIVIPLELIRDEGPAGVQKLLDEAPPKTVCVADSATDRDAAVVAAAVGQSSRRIMARVAASYVRARAGLSKQPLLTAKQLCDDNPNGGLVMVGSHVPKTTAQLEHLMEHVPSLHSIAISIEDVLQAPDDVVAEIVDELNNVLQSGKNAVVFTSRELFTADSDDENLEISNIISKCVSDIVAKLEVRPRYLIAKGGITSSDIATKSLGVKLATVAGSILPGIPVWRIGDEAKFPGMHYVIFPGNVGGDDALTAAVEKLSGENE
ncbi:four-carbon acid sugar kinase family protein [Mariniblastus fucicola]|uniref:Uncharacterized protein n=1 Tax=Mariniblastus fucicola TaxID=980251 RepID=A0A5B9PGG6_9BACT|nr:four-carbon acid sugar kinase family protein [Mariniblastus fucicola]QEG24350.1 hypothetical protein MFFC18_42690 [Mariniblastus fucicola]